MTSRHLDEPLTPRERNVLEQAAQGLTPIHIGRALCISPDCVRAHLRRAGRKLGATTREQAVQLYVTSANQEPTA